MKQRPPVTLDRIYEVIFSHVTLLQRAAILEDLEALEVELEEAERRASSRGPILPAPNCQFAQED